MIMIRAVLSLGQNCAPECLSLRFKKRDLTSVATALPEMNRRHLSITEIASHTQSYVGVACAEVVRITPSLVP